jgi:hypothetical protein
MFQIDKITKPIFIIHNFSIFFLVLSFIILKHFTFSWLRMNLYCFFTFYLIFLKKVVEDELKITFKVIIRHKIIVFQNGIQNHLFTNRGYFHFCFCMEISNYFRDTI